MSVDREELAKKEIGVTLISNAWARTITVVCALFLALVPFSQCVVELSEPVKGDMLPLPSVTGLLSNLRGLPEAEVEEDRGLFNRVIAVNDRFLAAIQTYEKDLENSSAFRTAILPPVQRFFARILRKGNEKAVVARDGWLFYERDIRALAGTPPVVAPATAAILDFADRLAERGIVLILCPVPVKPMFHPDLLGSSLPADGGYLRDPLFEQLKKDLEGSTVRVFDAPELLHRFASDSREPVFLKTDTHWTGRAVQYAGAELARFLENEAGLALTSSITSSVVSQPVSNTGDIARMLSLEDIEQTSIRRVFVQGQEMWQVDRQAEILLLGDSFTTIYSDSSMGWGDSAGLAEQLSHESGRPVDRIALNDNGAFASRQALQHELSRGRDVLAGKKVVVWEFALRELALGDWKILPLEAGIPTSAGFFVPENGTTVTASGLIRSLSARPTPRSTPYRDHIMAFHLVDLEIDGEVSERSEALVYAYSMIDYELTQVGRAMIGQRIKVQLHNWYDVEDLYFSINRSELSDDTLLLEDPCWGEELP